MDSAHSDLSANPHLHSVYSTVAERISISEQSLFVFGSEDHNPLGHIASNAEDASEDALVHTNSRMALYLLPPFSIVQYDPNQIVTFMITNFGRALTRET